MNLHFEHLHRSSVRETIAHGNLPELEHGLLKKYGDRLGWHTREKASFVEMAIDVLRAKQGHTTFEVHVRSFCHSRGVTADYLKFSERFNMKPCVLVIGDLGAVPAPWSELIQPAEYLHTHGYNMLWIEVPGFAHDPIRMLKYGPRIIYDVLGFLCIKKVSVVACGAGGSLFLQALVQSPSTFGQTHFIYNLDAPEAIRGSPFSIPSLEEILIEGKIQVWLGYTTEEGIFNHKYGDAMPARAYEAVSKLQTRLDGAKRRGRRSTPFDELLITDDLNANPKKSHVERVNIGRNVLLAFSPELLDSLVWFLKHAPQVFQDAVDTDGGLVVDPRRHREVLTLSDDPDLPALQRSRQEGFPALEDRAAVAAANRRRLDRVQAAALCLSPPLMQAALPFNNSMVAGGDLALTRPRLKGSHSVPSLTAAASQQEAAFAQSFWERNFPVEGQHRNAFALALPDCKKMPSEAYLREWAALRAG